MKDKQLDLALKEGWISIVVNSLLFVIKFWAGLVTNSVAIIADAWHTMSDSFTSLIVIIGAKVSNKPADEEHPFGHGRAELIGSVIIGVLLAVVAFNFIIESIAKLRQHESVNYGTFAIVVTAISVVVKEALAQYAFMVAKKSKAKSIKADAWHHRSDAISSLVILIGIFFSKKFWWMDGILGIFVAILIFYAVYEILRDTISSLLGEQAEEELIVNIKRIADQSSKYDVNPHHIHVHNYGNHTEISFHIKLPPEMPLDDAHQIATLIERNIKAELSMSATIHMEPGKI